MRDEELLEFENWLQQRASAMPYPHTPDLSARLEVAAQKKVRRPPMPRSLAWVGLALLVAFVAWMVAAPRARAALFEAIRVGAVRILIGEPTTTAEATPGSGGAAPSPSKGLGTRPAATTPFGLAAEGVQPTELPSILDRAQPSTLEEAAAALGAPIRLPSYPEGIGPPDRVYLGQFEIPLVILIWDQPGGPPEARLSLQIIRAPEEAFFIRKAPQIVARTTVLGNEAFWVTGPYYLELGGPGGEQVFRLLVEGNVLIWSEGPLTYRLESGLEREKAVRVAESLEDADRERLMLTPTASASAPEDCPVTRPPDPAFLPPWPDPKPGPSEHSFWYGTEELWTAVPGEGAWVDLPYWGERYHQKTFWWREGYAAFLEPNPELSVTGRRLDADAPPLQASEATNASNPDIRSAMLVGVGFPTVGCWEITGEYRDQVLSFVVWVEP